MNASLADLSAREAYVRRSSARLSSAIEMRDRWDVTETQREQALRRAVDEARGFCQSSAEKCADARAALLAVDHAWAVVEQTAVETAMSTERAMWEQQTVTSNEELTGESTSNGSNGGAPKQSEAYFAQRAAALELQAETLRVAGQTNRSAEAEARAVAAAAHAAVGAFQGVGGFSTPARSGVDDDSKCFDTAHETPSMGTCDRCLQPIDPLRHKDTAANLVEDATAARQRHVGLLESLNSGDFAYNEVVQLLRENSEGTCWGFPKSRPPCLPILVPEGTITSDCLRNTRYERLTLSFIYRKPRARSGSRLDKTRSEPRARRGTLR